MSPDVENVDSASEIEKEHNNQKIATRNIGVCRSITPKVDMREIENVQKLFTH